ncbi:RHTO0S11e02432g1_1 [Rhodotorula toruloides]|uniref:RHTO0S11e02432g1_1 n=1 Tax=Rhodotorula toruloides TaxID=5286 RepID=A0A061BF58_RHOTO|nr:RHTO0S11e02432g1_1 [Rhodotorula toruloides]
MLSLRALKTPATARTPSRRVITFYSPLAHLTGCATAKTTKGSCSNGWSCAARCWEDSLAVQAERGERCDLTFRLAKTDRNPSPEQDGETSAKWVRTCLRISVCRLITARRAQALRTSRRSSSHGGMLAVDAQAGSLVKDSRSLASHSQARFQSSSLAPLHQDEPRPLPVGLGLFCLPTPHSSHRLVGEQFALRVLLLIRSPTRSSRFPAHHTAPSEYRFSSKGGPSLPNLARLALQLAHSGLDVGSSERLDSRSVERLIPAIEASLPIANRAGEAGGRTLGVEGVDLACNVVYPRLSRWRETTARHSYIRPRLTVFGGGGGGGRGSRRVLHTRAVPCG